MVSSFQTVNLSTQQLDFDKVTQYLVMLMLRNFSSTGYSFTDPWYPDTESTPGCVIASPSFYLDEDGNIVDDDPNVRQNYVYNWTRDAALVITELASVDWPLLPGVDPTVFDEYVTFAQTCQQNAVAASATVPDIDLSYACYRVNGLPRDHPKWWTRQHDGPALQTLAVLAIWDKVSAGVKPTALAVANTNVEWLLENNHYQQVCFSPWEEREGECFFTLATILKCLQAVKGNPIGIHEPTGIDEAMDWLKDRIGKHWSADHSSYVSIGTDFLTDDYDPNLDIVLSCLYGAIDPVDDKLLSSAGNLRAVWAVPVDSADPVSGKVYQVNKTDWQARGPLLGRYPSDKYDGDGDGSGVGHPWALATSGFAELYYRVAATIKTSGTIPLTKLSTLFFRQAGITAATAVADAVMALCAAGDKMLAAILYHSDHLELSEQFDRDTGFEKSVQNLTWSYASFLSALRARAGCC